MSADVYLRLTVLNMHVYKFPFQTKMYERFALVNLINLMAKNSMS